MDNQTLQQQVSQLQQQVNEILQWKAQKMAQQISYPLDKVSLDILNKSFPTFDAVLNSLGATGNEFPLAAIMTQGNQNYYLQTTNPIFLYTVNTSTDYLTVKIDAVAGPFNGTIRFVNGTLLALYTDNTFPTGTTPGAGYYVINSNGLDTFQISLTAGGSAVNLTSTGIGNQYITFG